ncbi:hypothetical protein GPECTOR_60g759 [Gonium pectorale]|uniref:Phosphate transporter n=1 Tax=Gonium pectorale TaxID=33097 RepID=A0A150G582_GONPE|nr:hypothetical protein GPECTOR_60g759 [Gonium pectorale]|eukprot:KXZ44981.1 hypothetical protein GPECTOR_60g759 [Gonium pectorale]
MAFVLQEYLWLVVVGSLAAFAFGWGTGSNDVANAFGTSVGAKTLTLKQAVVIAAVFEFTGALVLGRVSTATIAGSIAQISYFQAEPEIYAYGMVCALAVGFLWQGLASYWELNVSATHSIIGSIIGFTMVYRGAGAVNWSTPDPNSFPPVKGVVPIVITWFLSPLFTGVAAAAIFLAVRTAVLRRRHSFELSFWVLPVLVLITTFINIFFVFTKGAKKTFSKEQWTDAKSAWVSMAVAGGLALLTGALVLPLLRRKATRKFAREALEALEAAAAEEAAAAKMAAEAARRALSPSGASHEGDPEMGSGSGSGSTPARTSDGKGAADASGNADGDGKGGGATPQQPVGDSPHSSFNDSSRKVLGWMRKAALHGVEVDIHQIVRDDPIVAAIHRNAEVFEPRAEYVFSFLQVFSAICVIFAHGAGEVGYMAGPLATIWYAVKDGALPTSVTAPVWAIIISAMGLVVGLASYGYNVTRAMGTRMAKLSPSRGFAAELSTALVILVCSQYGLPTSSSQCIVGGIVGVGAVEGRTGVNWMFLLKTFTSWVATLVVVGLATAALFAQGAFAPSISSNKVIAVYESRLVGRGQAIAHDLNATLLAYRAAAVSGRLSRLDAASWRSLDASVAKLAAQGSRYLNTKQTGTIQPNDAADYLDSALALLAANSVLTVGQEHVFPGAPACNGPAFSPAAPNFTVPCPAPKPLASGTGGGHK